MTALRILGLAVIEAFGIAGIVAAVLTVGLAL